MNRDDHSYEDGEHQKNRITLLPILKAEHGMNAQTELLPS